MTDKKTILLLDTGFSSLPIYEYLVSLDADVWVMGGRPDDVVAKRAGDHWICQDYSDQQAVNSWIENHAGALLVPGCTDLSLAVTAETRRSPHVDDPEVIDVFGDKQKFRTLCADLGLPTPKVLDLSDFPRQGTYICKPVDSFSGRGITVVSGGNLSEVSAAAQKASEVSRTGQAMFEEFIEGQSHSYSCFVENQRVVNAFSVKEGSSANPFAIDTSFVLHQLDKDIISRLETYVNAIAKKLQLKDGLIHVQYILRDSVPVLIEATRRCPGDLYALLIQYSTGYPYAAKYASYFVQESIPVDEKLSRYIVRHTVTSVNTSVNCGLRFLYPMNVLAFYPLQRLGEQLLPNQKARSGLLYIETKSQEEVSKVFEDFCARKYYFE